MVAVGPGGLLPELYRLVVEGRERVVWIHASGAALRIELVDGWVHAFAELSRDADDAEERQRLRRARPPLDAERAFADALAQRAAEDARLAPADEPRERLGSVPPFHPLRALRRVAQGVLDVLDATPLDARLGEGRLGLAARVHNSGLDPDERGLLALVASSPCPYTELLARGGCAPARASALLRQLALLGVLVADERPLELDVPAWRGALAAHRLAQRRAYHAAAREVHPDLHPEDDDTARARRNAEMAALAERHRRG